MPDSAKGLPLALCSGITTERAWRTIWDLRIKPGLAVWKLSTAIYTIIVYTRQVSYVLCCHSDLSLKLAANNTDCHYSFFVVVDVVFAI